MGVRLDAAFLRRELDARGLHGQDLARLTGLTPATISACLNHHEVSPRTMRLIAEALERVRPIPTADQLVARPDRLEAAPA